MSYGTSCSPCVKGELSLNEIQNESLRILKDIDAVCRREGINYWLAYGSLIGAVRHHGFIPWDDDLDIFMPRSDYERFLACFDGRAVELTSYVAINPDIELKRPFLITRVSNPAFKMIGEYGDELNELGTFVDVYPLDGLGDTIDESLRRKKTARKLARNYMLANNYDCYWKNKSALKRLAWHARSLIRTCPEKYQERLNRLCLEYGFEDCRFVTCLNWVAMPYKLLYERSWFNDTVYMKFEDAEFAVPAGYDELLRCDYGDYMRLPPESDRVGHHFYSIVKRDHC